MVAENGPDDVFGEVDSGTTDKMRLVTVFLKQKNFTFSLVLEDGGGGGGVRVSFERFPKGSLWSTFSEASQRFRDVVGQTG